MLKVTNVTTINKEDIPIFPCVMMDDRTNLLVLAIDKDAVVTHCIDLASRIDSEHLKHSPSCVYNIENHHLTIHNGSITIENK